MAQPERRRRQSRIKRKPSSASPRPRKRSIRILKGLAGMKFLTTTQLANVYFKGSKSNANKALGRLFGNRFIKAWTRRLSYDNVYSITAAGLRELNMRDANFEITVSPPRQLDGNLDHLLAINDVRIALAKGLAKRQSDISSWRTDYEMPRLGKNDLIPDALFVISWNGTREQVYGLELEFDTRAPQRFQQQMIHYDRVRKTPVGLYGCSDFTLLIVGKDERCIKSYHRAAKTLQLEPWVWFATLDAVIHSDVDVPIWQAVDNDRKSSLQNLPYEANKGSLR